MLAYIFWHTPLADIDVHDYETALLGFHTDLAADPPTGLEASATYQISEVPWLNDRPGYEDWCFVKSSALWIASIMRRSDQSDGMCMLQFRARQISDMVAFTTTYTGTSNQSPARG